MTDLPGQARQIALGVVGFVATLILLFGLINVIGRSRGGGVGVQAPSPSASRSTAGPSASGPAASPSAGAASPSGSVPSPSGDPVLIGAGDIADCELDGDSATAALLDTLGGTVFTAGDNVYPDGTGEQFSECYASTWGRHLARTRPAPGNHDRNTKDLAGYLGYFGAAASPHGTPWYSYDLGAWHVIVLDSNCGQAGGCDAESEQGRWLAADLAATTATCTLAMWHHPRFTSGEHGDDRGVGPFWETLYAAGADVVINGHDHDYERFAPQDPTGREDRARGIREFVVGTGGAALRGFPRIAPNSELRLSLTHGLLRLVLHESSYEWSFIPTTGDVTDQGNGPCH